MVRLCATRTVAAALIVMMAVGTRVTPAKAGGTGCSACVRDARGNVTCKHVAASSAAKSHSCCKAGGSSKESPRPSAPCGSESDGCACPGRQCCLIQGSTPAFVVTHHRVQTYTAWSAGPALPAVVPPPAGVHESVFHPPRA